LKANYFGDPNPRLQLRIQQGHLRTALRILHNAWPATLADSRVSTTAHEDDITNVLRREMVCVKKAMKPQPRFRIEREPQSDIVDDGTPIGLIDIQIGYAFDEVLYIAIECKRISSAGNTLARKYVREGIHRFVTGKYSGGHALGGMVGYVICGNPAACTTRVQQQLVKESVEITGYDAESGWIESRSWVPYETLYESRHRQMGDSHVIVLVHSFLTVF